MCKDVIYAIDGCIVKVKETTSFSMLEKVFVGKRFKRKDGRKRK